MPIEPGPGCVRPARRGLDWYGVSIVGATALAIATAHRGATGAAWAALALLLAALAGR